MSTRRQPESLPPRKPTGSRPLPKRLFSFDSDKTSIKSSRTVSDSRQVEESISEDGRLHTRIPSKASTLQLLMREDSNEDPFTDPQRWTGGPLVDSPTTASDFDPIGPPPPISSPGIHKRSFSPKLISSLKSSTGAPSKSQTGERLDLGPTRTPSRVRWEQLRQHVVPVSPRPSSPAPSVQQSGPNGVLSPSRPQTPKPSRLARLGFRHVVEHAREAAIDDSRKFSDDIFRVCWSARAPDSSFSRVPKNEREATIGTMGSNLYLPFMSTNGLPTSAASSTTTFIPTAQKDPRRPQSISSIRQAVSPVLSLHEVILRYASRNSSYLPHENLVLSTLLTPFLAKEASPSIDDDRWTAIETFEVAVKTWRPASYELDVGRCLWCCRAASTLPSIQTRVLGVLASLLFPRTGPFEFRNHHVFLSLVQGLFGVLISIMRLVSPNSELTVVTELVSQIRAGSCGSLASYFAEAEIDGSPVAVTEFDEGEIREALVAEAIVKCMENDTEANARWILHNILQDFWLAAIARSESPLLAAIRIRKLNSFNRAAMKLLSTSEDTKDRSSDARMILGTLNSRIILEASSMTGKRATDASRIVIRLIMKLLCVPDVLDVHASVANVVAQLYRQDTQWQIAFEKAVQSLISDNPWPEILTTLHTCFKQLTEDVRKPIFMSVLVSLNERLVLDPPAHPCTSLSALLNNLSQMYPQVFYKPLFACAASTKELAVVNHLGIITAIANFLPDFWTRDPEMTLVALMKDVGKPVEGESGLVWGKARLGQTTLLLELIAKVRSLSRPAQEMTSIENSALIAAARFFTTLEMRLGIMIEARERTNLIPLPHRVLFAVLFREIRLLTKSLKRSPWYGSTISWTLQSHAGAAIESGTSNLIVGDDAIDEVTQHLGKLDAIYAAAKDSQRASHQRRSTIFLFSSTDSHPHGDVGERSASAIAMFEERSKLVASLPRNVVACTLELLVVISGSLTVEDHHRLGPYLWSRCLDGTDVQATNLAAFLIMHCVEKAPSIILDPVKGDLCSAESTKKINAVQRLSLLINLRWQLLYQPYLPDRNRRRPFRFARDPLPFVATDVGSSLFVREEEDGDDSVKGSMPLELRRRLSEVGWMDDKQPADQKREWIYTPLSLLPGHQNDRVNTSERFVSSSPTASPTATPTKPRSNSDAAEPTLFRRASDPASRGIKRRAIFAPTLAAIFPCMAGLVFDSHFAVASIARDCVLDLMRNDPALLVRPIFDLLANDELEPAFTAIRAMLHIRTTLPPAVTHYSFNHLTGYLKFVSRESSSNNPLRGFAHAASILSKLVTQVSEMSIREIRRAKVEIFLIPSGSLWFPTSAPTSLMFPKALQLSRNPFELSPSLVSITMIRMSQNMLFLSMLKRHPHGVQIIRKSMSRLVLPSLDPYAGHKPLELTDFIPRRSSQEEGVSSDATLVALSSTLARSYLLLAAQVFRSMSRHLSDRNELAIFIDGINRILLAHGDDIGIVSQAMIALMVASTRFRRLFTSGGGYPVFMPVVVKIYSEQEHHHGIRHAIEYATNRFYALHQEVFLFQTLEVVTHIAQSPGCDADWTAQNVYQLLSSLQRSASQPSTDAAGIRNSNRTQEREALLITTAEETPQAFLASIRQTRSQGKEQVIVDLPEEYETRAVDIDNLVRLLLTVIAHDPTIQRAEYFLHFLRILAPDFYNATKAARTVLREGIDALGTIVMRAVTKSKLSDILSMPSLVDTDLGSSKKDSYVADQLHTESRAPGDIMAMRLEYLQLIEAFVRIGGQLSASTPTKIFDIVKLLLREAPQTSTQVAEFLAAYTELSLIRTSSPSIKEVCGLLSNLAPVMSSYASAVNFAGAHRVISQLCANPNHSKEPPFTNLIVSQICRAGLEAHESMSSQGHTVLSSDNAPFISILAQAVTFHDADVIAEIEKHSPSYHFLAGIVLPLVLTLKTSPAIESSGQPSDSWSRNALAGAWIRLLSYAMASSRKHNQPRASSYSPERSKSQSERRSTTGKEHVMTLVASLQVIKVIIVRAQDELSAHLPGAWSRIGSFLKSLLADGDVKFALASQDQSAPPSPVHSPRSSVGSFDPFNPHDTTINASAALPSPPAFQNPRVVDYALWSLLELICLHRSPLMIQLRIVIQEKLLFMNEDIRAHQSGSSRSRSRRVSSMFTKPRRRTSSIHSGISSIPSSPVLGASQSALGDLSLHPPELNLRTPGFQRSPTSSPGDTMPRIIHLGPVHPSTMPNFAERRSMSPSGVHHLTKSETIKSLPLIRATYRRIRLVQACMGYDLLLPMPGDHDNEEGFSATKAWTKREALEAVIQEMKELSGEFSDTWKEVEDDVVVVDPDESVTF
ncbi:hypothetical protein BJ138DRAFT_1128802 [Hygrophoropsis aurantiaca]|uniref:Uncharacterized protein n=1 Tax=Hygrophoropsis aurantiaca TaxID=72124 RepID=A0ACB8A3L2_9AGAM|nr:hypothetical protein BJ138DRAFT_1128802 [Hygrophoropsis aurantiaca]